MRFRDMEVQEVVLTAIAIWIMILVTVFICAKREFRGYYLCQEEIYGSHSWEPDMQACDYNEDTWKYIVDSDLHMIKK